MQKISSPDNPLLKHVRRLLRDGRYRRLKGEFVLEGSRSFDSVRGLRTLLLREGSERPRRFAESSPGLGVPSGLGEKGPWETRPRVFSLSPRIFDPLADTDTSQGILGICAIPSPGALLFPGKYLYLDGIQDPGNLGTLLRTAAAFGMTGVLCGRGSTDPFGPKATRAAAGAVFRIPIFTNQDPGLLVGRRLIAADAAGIPLDDYSASEDFILVLGNEGGGISPAVLDLCGERLAIPMPGGTESLNVAVAAGIILYALTGPH